MKHHYISIFAVFLGMLAVLDGRGDLGNAGFANEQEASVPMVVASGTGVVEAIHVRSETGNGSERALLGTILLDEQQQRGLGGAKVYSIRVRMGDGETQTVLQDSAAGLRVGERVRLDSGRVYSS